MSNIEDRDEQAYLNSFEEQPELPYDWDSEEAQGTAEELRAEVVRRTIVKVEGDFYSLALTFDDGTVYRVENNPYTVSIGRDK